MNDSESESHSSLPLEWLFYYLKIPPVGVSDAGRNHALFLSYGGRIPEAIVVGEQPRAPFGSLLSTTVSLRCILSGEQSLSLTLPFVINLSAA